MSSSSSSHRVDRDRSRSRSRSRDRHHTHRHHQRERDRDRDRDRKSTKDDRRSRSRSRSRSRERERQHRRSRSRSVEKQSTSNLNVSADSKRSQRELEKTLKTAKKLLKDGKMAEAAALIDPKELEELLEREKKKAEASEKRREEKKKKSKKSKSSKKDKKRKRDRSESESQSSDDDSPSESESESESEDDSQSKFLADGKTPRLTRRDYFQRSTEFRLWLHSNYGKHIDDISTKRSHKYFRRFVREWNSGKLSSNYYNGIDSSSIGAATMTKHRWSFASKLTPADKMQLDTVRDNIDTSTYHHSYQQEFKGESTLGSQRAAASSSIRSTAPTASQAASADITDWRKEKLEQKVND